MQLSLQKVSLGFLRLIIYSLLAVFSHIVILFFTFVFSIYLSPVSNSHIVAKAFDLDFFMFIFFFIGGVLMTLVVASVPFLSPLFPSLQKVRLFQFIGIYLLTGVTTAGLTKMRLLYYILPADFLSLGVTFYFAHKFILENSYKKFRKKIVGL